jgi:hypothetical protein
MKYFILSLLILICGKVHAEGTVVNSDDIVFGPCVFNNKNVLGTEFYKFDVFVRLVRIDTVMSKKDKCNYIRKNLLVAIKIAQKHNNRITYLSTKANGPLSKNTIVTTVETITPNDPKPAVAESSEKNQLSKTGIACEYVDDKVETVATCSGTSVFVANIRCKDELGLTAESVRSCKGKTKPSAIDCFTDGLTAKDASSTAAKGIQ